MRFWMHPDYIGLMPCFWSYIQELFQKGERPAISKMDGSQWSSIIFSQTCSAAAPGMDRQGGGWAGVTQGRNMSFPPQITVAPCSLSYLSLYHSVIPSSWWMMSLSDYTVTKPPGDQLSCLWVGYLRGEGWGVGLAITASAWIWPISSPWNSL